MFPPDFAQNAIIMHRDNLRISIEKSIENWNESRKFITVKSKSGCSSQVYQSELNTANVPVFLGLNSPKMGKNLIFFNKNQFKGRGGGSQVKIQIFACFKPS